jgi:hypothetical protein
VDVKLSFRSTLSPEALLTIHCQVKHGLSYKESKPNAKSLEVRINRPTVEALRLGGKPSLLVWLPPVPSPNVYWHIFDGRQSTRTLLQIPRCNHVTPALRFYLSRVAAFINQQTGYTEVTVKTRAENLVQSVAKSAFKVLQSREWNHPLFGPLTVSLHALRHVTRRSKPARERIQALKVAPYLEHFLDKHPSRILLSEAETSIVGGRRVERRRIILWYKGALRIDGRSHCLLFRIQETISYPKAWERMPLSVADVRQGTRLESWWCKEEK